MHCSFAFSHSPTGKFLVLLEQSSANPIVTLTAFEDENDFIQDVVLSLSSNAAIMDVIAHILLATSGRHSVQQWISLELPAAEVQALGLSADIKVPGGLQTMDA